MGTLTFIRHGQASFLGEDYDRLSPLGERQAEALGRFLAARGERVDEVFVGPRRRHHGTAAGVARGFASAGREWPAAVELAGLDEHDAVHRALLDRAAMGRHFPQLVEMEREMREAADGEARQRAFGRLFAEVTTLWQRDELPFDGLETWGSFLGRVRAAIAQMVAASRASSRRVLVFTSGGPIAVALTAAVGGDEQRTLELAARVMHTSLTRLLFRQADAERPARLTLDTFNDAAHLDDPETRTYL